MPQRMEQGGERGGRINAGADHLCLEWVEPESARVRELDVYGSETLADVVIGIISGMGMGIGGYAAAVRDLARCLRARGGIDPWTG